MARSGISPRERKARSRLAQLVHQVEFVRGGLSVRSRRCGAANCKCTRGEPHVSLYLATSHDGRQRQVYVPAEMEDAVRLWAAHYQEIRDLLEELSRIQWDKLQRRGM